LSSFAAARGRRWEIVIHRSFACSVAFMRLGFLICQHPSLDTDRHLVREDNLVEAKKANTSRPGRVRSLSLYDLAWAFDAVTLPCHQSQGVLPDPDIVPTAPTVVSLVIDPRPISSRNHLAPDLMLLVGFRYHMRGPRYAQTGFSSVRV
jgi:hypothetical protein